MKNITFVLGIFALAIGLPAAEQTLLVTPQNLDGWIATGADKSSLSQHAGLALPRGGQLSRSFDVGLVSVRLNTPLVFGLAGEDFPTLEVGPVALVFSREEGVEGQLILVTRDSGSNPLPFAVKLASDGTSIDPIDVQLAYERGTGVVTITGFGQSLRYNAQASAQPVEVVFTAGAHDAWPLENLSLRLVTADDVPADGGKDAKKKLGSSDENTSSTASRKKTRTGPSSTDDGGMTTSGEPEDKKPIVQGGRALLEVYTPAAVRHGRVDAIRATVVQGKKL